MNRKQRRTQKVRSKEPNKQGIKTTVSDARLYADAGARAYAQGHIREALASYAQAVRTQPDCHAHKVRLAHILRHVRVETFRPQLKELVTLCLSEEGIDYQDLAWVWFSLVLYDPALQAFCALVHGADVPASDVQSCLDDDFLLQGITRLTIFDMRFESALVRARACSQSCAFDKAFDAYCRRTEYVFTDLPAGPLYDETSLVADDDIGTLGLSDDAVSALVRQHYEENPYPCWESLHVQDAPRAHQGDMHRRLIAGCGTGFGACSTSLSYPDAQITAIDLSRTSLRYAAGKARALGLSNLRFYQGDILALDDLSGEFDVIECSGVLHHMDDPLAGWRALLRLLAPDGRMHIGLYSDLGRRDVVAARALIAQHGMTPTHDGMRMVRNLISRLPDKHPAKPVMLRRDFYSFSGCRDLIFHKKEHRFTLPQITEALDALGLVFDGFDVPFSARQDAPSLQTLSNWHGYEQVHPDAFRGMYQFWCRKRTA